MKTIKAFPLSIEPQQKVDIPFGSEVLTKGNILVIDGRPTLFVQIDSSYSRGDRTFHIFATDKEVPQRFNQTHYVGCFDYDGTTLHVFEDR